MPAALLSWGLLPRLEGLGVVGMEVEKGNRMKGIPPGKQWCGFGWKLVLSDEERVRLYLQQRQSEVLPRQGKLSTASIIFWCTSLVGKKTS